MSGKGIKSSLLMSKASSLYRCCKSNFSASDLLYQLNNEICETISRGMFVTMIIGIYDKKQELLLSSVTTPLIYSNDGTFLTLMRQVLRLEYGKHKISRT